MAIGTETKLSALFHDSASADRAYQAAIDRGYTRDDMTVAMTSDAREKHYPHGSTLATESEEGNLAAEGAGIGGGIGSVAGAIIGAIAAIGTTLFIPGLNLLIAGPLAAGLAGAGAGGLTGGLVGALIGLGMPEEEAKAYESGLQEGHIVLGVATRSNADADAIAADWRSCGATRVDRY